MTHIKFNHHFLRYLTAGVLMSVLALSLFINHPIYVWPFSRSVIGTNIDKINKQLRSALSDLQVKTERFYGVINMNIKDNSKEAQKANQEREQALTDLIKAIEKVEEIETHLHKEQEEALQAASDECASKKAALDKAHETWYQNSLNVRNVAKAKYKDLLQVASHDYEKAREVFHEAEDRAAKLLENIKNETYNTYVSTKERANNGVKQIQTWTQKAGQKTKEAAQNVAHHFEETEHSLLEKAKEWIKRAKDQSTRLKNRVAQLVTRQKNAAESSLKDTKDKLKKHAEHEGAFNTIKDMAVDSKNYAVEKANQIKDYLVGLVSRHEMTVAQAKEEERFLIEQAKTQGEELKHESEHRAKELEINAKERGALLVKDAREHEKQR